MKKILIVDDKKNVRTSLSIGLKREGFDVDVAGNALEALSKMRKIAYDILLSDVKMPEMNGFELAMEIAKLFPQVHTILMSAYNFRDYEERYGRLENYAKISKPFEMDELLTILNQSDNNNSFEEIINEPVLVA